MTSGANMTLNIDQAIRNARSEIKAGRPGLARAAMLAALDRFPGNSRLMSLLIEAHEAATGVPARPFGPKQLERFRQIRANMGLLPAVEEAAAWARLNQKSALAQNLFGQGLEEAGYHEPALTYLRLAVQLDPAFPGASVNLSTALMGQGRTTEAGDVLQALLAHVPDYMPALIGLSQIRTAQCHHAETVSILRRMDRIAPNNADYTGQFAAALIANGQMNEAKALLEKAIATWPDDFRFDVNLGNLLLTMGETDKGADHFRRAIEKNPRSGSALFSLSRATDLKIDDPLVTQMLALIDDPDASDKEKEALHFALASAYENSGDIARSFWHLEQGNGIRAKESNYSIAAQADFYLDLRRRFARDALPPLPAAEHLRRRPIFILGMMRSGTTLTEQILSSHSQVYGAGELEILSALLAAEREQPTKELDTAALQRIRSGYLSRIDALAGDEPVIVDKLPANFRLIGLIRKALPEAKILHMQRDPVAVCWSIYKTHFTNDFGYADTLEGVAQYHDLYVDMMNFWRQEYPGEFMEVDYEKLTREPEASIRAILEYCELPFEAACLAPQENKRTVRTASMKQVRTGIYTGSSSKWKGFEPYITPLLDHFAKKQ